MLQNNKFVCFIHNFSLIWTQNLFKTCLHRFSSSERNSSKRLRSLLVLAPTTVDGRYSNWLVSCLPSRVRLFVWRSSGFPAISCRHCRNAESSRVFLVTWVPWFQLGVDNRVETYFNPGLLWIYRHFSHCFSQVDDHHSTHQNLSFNHWLIDNPTKTLQNRHPLSIITITYLKKIVFARLLFYGQVSGVHFWWPLNCSPRGFPLPAMLGWNPPLRGSMSFKWLKKLPKNMVKDGDLVKHFMLNLFWLKYFICLNSPWIVRKISVDRSGNGKWDPVQRKGYLWPLRGSCLGICIIWNNILLAS